MKNAKTFKELAPPLAPSSQASGSSFDGTDERLGDDDTPKPGSTPKSSSPVPSLGRGHVIDNPVNNPREDEVRARTNRTPSPPQTNTPADTTDREDGPSRTVRGVRYSQIVTIIPSARDLEDLEEDRNLRDGPRGWGMLGLVELVQADHMEHEPSMLEGTFIAVTAHGE
ncbi:hypothetical protein B0T17DRAFT_656416 [Bombardia bombarda]|uniref:Uncharacterized protein n=1 Tax=Bombardia bombarda TaxID=252184 RepID=A0AA39WMV8_9PEZI|nr:hypothetical protein B0T17DRAFT_656416 [Bombardia bombarda]